MLGAVTQFVQAGGIYGNITGTKWSAFIQDDWRASSRLTLSGGLRWDPYFPYADSEGRLPCFERGKQSVSATPMRRSACSLPTIPAARRAPFIATCRILLRVSALPTA